MLGTQALLWGNAGMHQGLSRKGLFAGSHQVGHIDILGEGAKATCGHTYLGHFASVAQAKDAVERAYAQAHGLAR